MLRIKGCTVRAVRHPSELLGRERERERESDTMYFEPTCDFDVIESLKVSGSIYL
jgi:hypothetical protein